MSEADSRRVRRWAILAWALFGIELVGAIVRAALGVATGKPSAIGESVLFFVFPAVGVVLASRRPTNPIGWLMLAIGIAFASPGVYYAGFATVDRDRPLPLADWAMALDSPMWVPFIGLSGYIVLLFPDGHLPSPRWRWFARVCAVGLVALFLVILLSPGTGAESGLPQLHNPLGVEALRSLWEGPALLLIAFAPLAVAGGAVGAIVRVRRTRDPIARLQLRWLTWAAGVIATVYLFAFIPGLFGLDRGSTWTSWVETLSAGSFVLIPVAVGIAVLRYRLLDIDFVIRKTVVFAVVAAFIAVVYAALVVGVGALVGTQSSPALSAVAAAVVALVFQPVRVRARRLADRVVYGRRATPYEVMAEFGDQLAGAYAADDVLPRIARVLAEGVGAEVARVWLRVGDDLRVVGAWPADASSGRPDDFAAEVRHKGEELGALSVVVPANDPMDPARERLVTDLAAQAGLVLSNVRLTEELRARLADLTAAQKRLVDAQNHERRRLERNIHDGAQQQLVALAVKARLARRFAEHDAERAAALLQEIEDETQVALEDLRDLARGIFPPLLADRGLVAALEAQAQRAPLPTTVEAEGVGRYAQDVEAAVYFSTLEAIQNAAKYAEADRVVVRLRQVNGDLRFSVTDDGKGFDPEAIGYGTGLQGIADRLGALDGNVDVRSRPGEGTTVAGTVRLQVGTVAS